MDNKEWVTETDRRLGLVSQYFKTSENRAIIDFIRTAEDVSELEKN